MKLSDTIDPNQVRSAPFERDEPAKEWRNARQQRLLPPAVLEFYESTSFLSASRLAGFDTERKRVVTVYIGRVFGSLKECIEEAEEQKRDHNEQIARTYNPLRLNRDEAAEEIARRRARGAFRLFLIDIFGALDAVAELIALLLPGEIKSLRLGRGMFTKQIYDWARSALPQPGLIVSPARPHLEKLHAYVRRHIVDDRVGAAWFDLLRLYRNKVTHLGHQAWPELGLQGRDEKIYYFLPRSWPFIAERHLQVGPADRAPTQSLREHLNESLVHIDIIELVDETYGRAVTFIDGCVSILLETYRVLGVRRIASLRQSSMSVTSPSSRASKPPANYCPKLARPGFGPAAEPPTWSPARWRHAVADRVALLQLNRGNQRAALASARGPWPCSLGDSRCADAAGHPPGRSQSLLPTRVCRSSHGLRGPAPPPTARARWRRRGRRRLYMPFPRSAFAWPQEYVVGQTAAYKRFKCAAQLSHSSCRGPAPARRLRA